MTATSPAPRSSAKPTPSSPTIAGPGFSTARVLVEADIETVHPNQFAANTVSARPHAGMRALREMSNRRTNPPQTPEQILELLVTRHNMTEVAEILLPLLSDTGDPADQARKALTIKLWSVIGRSYLQRSRRR